MSGDPSATHSTGSHRQPLKGQLNRSGVRATIVTMHNIRIRFPQSFLRYQFQCACRIAVIMIIAELEQSTLCLLVSGTARKMQPAISCNRDNNSDMKRKNKLETILAHLRWTYVFSYTDTGELCVQYSSITTLNRKEE